MASPPFDGVLVLDFRTFLMVRFWMMMLEEALM
jgi:hypothetical protein